MKRIRLSPSQTVLVAAAGAAMILFVTVIASRVAVSLQRLTEDALVARLGDVYLDGLSAAVAPDTGPGRQAALAAALERVATYSDGVREVRIVIRGGDGAVLGDLARDEAARRAVLPPLDRTVPLTTDNDRNRVWVQRPLSVPEGGTAVLSAQLDLRPIRDDRRSTDLESLATNTVLAIGFAFLGYRLIRRLLMPLERLEAALERAAAEEPRPIDTAGLATSSPRIRRLVEIYNRMAQALGERRQMQIALSERLRAADLGRLAATVAHEVRNPMAGMFNALDTARRFPHDAAAVAGSLDLVERGLAAIASVVDTTLSLYRAPLRGKALEPVDVDDLEKLIRPLARRRSVRLDWTNRLAETVEVDAFVFRQIVLNLAINAVAAARPAGVVSVDVARGPDGLAVAVGDDGDGLEPETAARLERPDVDWVDTDEAGIGLGVVVRGVASLGGHIALHRSETPPATTFALTIPIAGSRREPTGDPRRG